MKRQQAGYQRAITNIALHKNMPRIALQWRQGFQITRVGQLVQINDWLIAASQPVQNEVGANKTGTAGDKNGHEKVKVIV